MWICPPGYYQSFTNYNYGGGGFGGGGGGFSTGYSAVLSGGGGGDGGGAAKHGEKNLHGVDQQFFPDRLRRVWR